jgi:SPP1 family predicted phage head-tail adaptor
MLGIGRLRHRAIFERLGAGTKDAYGNTRTTWAELCRVWGNLRETPGKERLAAGRGESTTTATFRARRTSELAGVTAEDRVQVQGRTWNIRAIARLTDRGDWIEFELEAGGAT